MKVEKTNNGKKGGLLKGKPHYDKDGNSLGGIKAVVTDAGNRPVELEGGEVIINKEASKKHWKLLSKINQSAGGGVPIGPPSGADFDEDPEEFKEGGRIIEFNPNHVPNKWVVQYAEKIKKDHPEIWKLGGNIFGNQAFENLLRVSKRGYWLDSEEWMYIKWRSYVARHIHDFRIEGVVAMLKWCDKVEKGWAYMKDLIEEKIDKIESKEEKASTKMANGGEIENIQMEMKLLKKQYPKAVISYYFAKNPNGKNYVIQAKENGKVIYSSYKNKMATGGGLEKQNDTAKSLRERYIKLWRSLEENDLDVLLNYDDAFEEAGDVLGNLETLKEDYKNWLKNKGYSSKDSWKHEKTFLSHPIIAKKLKAAFSEKNKLINQEIKNIEKQLFSMYPVLAKVNKELDDYTGGPILAQKVYKSGKSWTIVVPNYDVRDVYLSSEQVDDLKKYIKESTSNVKMATGGGVEKQTTGNKILDKLARLLKQPKATIEITSNQVRSINGKFSFSGPSTFFVKKSPSNDYYFLMTNKGTYRVEEKDVSKAEDLYDELESIIQAGRTKRAVECDLSGNPIMAKGGEVGKIAPDRINELSATLLNQLKRYAKENYNEDVIDDTFMLKGEEKNKDFQVKEVSIDTASGREIHITIQELFMKRGGELSKGIRAELEHKKTISKIYNREVSKSKAAELIAKDHLKEDPKYYSKLEQIEGKKFATGSTIEKFDIGDRVYLNTKKGKIEVIVTKYSDKWVQFDDLTKGKSGRWKATPEFKQEFDSFVNQPTSTTTAQPTTTSTPVTTNGFKVGDILEWKEDLQPLYNAKKGDKAKVIEIATEGEEYDIYVEWISATTQENGWYLSSMFVKAKNQVLPKSKTPQATSNSPLGPQSIIIENLEVYNEDFGRLTWYEAMRKASELGEGWRLPTIEEYKKILYPNSTKFAFPNERSWSIDENNNKYAWYFNFTLGKATPQNYKQNFYKAVFVKDISSSTTSTTQQPASNSTIIENLEVYNEDLGKMTWDEATQKVKELGEGWRLPTKIELKNILYPNKSKIPNLKEDDYYWSSTEYVGGNAGTFGFDDGDDSGSDGKNFTYYVRAVRDLSISTTSTTQQPASSATQQKGLPSTDPKTWNGEFKVGDRVKVRWDFSNDLGNGNAKVDYFSKENDFTIISIVKRFAKPEPDGIIRPENPSGFLYKVNSGDVWEGKDLELITTSQTTQQPASTTQQPAPKRQPKIEEPEPPKRKFKEGADYLKIFTEYFEKDTQMGKPVKSESFTKAIVNNFIIATEDIGGFSKDKLKEIKSFIDKE